MRKEWDNSPIRTYILLICVFYYLLLTPSISCSQGTFWELPPLPPYSQYGNIIIHRALVKLGKPGVTFSHWSHRLVYTCRVCHFELNFEMKVNTTIITEEQNRNGRFCGACHDGKTAFGHTRGNCRKCHNENIKYGEKKLNKLKDLPSARYGNGVDWYKSITDGLIKPKQSIIEENFRQIPYDQELILEAAWAMISPAVFSHKAHVAWLDCANCHPDIFNVMENTTEHFAMKYILEEKFCGVCHLKVAFPLNDCQRCHPGMKK